MSNERNLHFKSPANYYDLQNSSGHSNYLTKITDPNQNSFSNSNSRVKSEIHENPCYYKSNDSNGVTSPSNTILITHNYSSETPIICSNNNKSSSSSITIVTTHNSNTNIESNQTNSIKNEENSQTYQKATKSNTENSSPVVLEGINILINNHFNEPSSSSSDSCNQLVNSNYRIKDVMDQTHASTSKLIKSEKIDITTTEPDSTTSGLSPEKNLKMTNSNDTGFSSNSSSSVSSNSSAASTSSNYCNQQTCQFSSNMNVLVQKKDQKFYLGVIQDVFATEEKCLIKFDDNSDYLADFDEMKILGSSDGTSDAPMCVVCKKINDGDIVESCERCLRGYHRLCAEGGYKNGIWTCKKCTAENGVKKSEEQNDFKSFVDKSKIRKFTHISHLPYNLNALIWDLRHRVNQEQIYCYCGKTGRWDHKMLQCLKCLQWFHEKCIKHLHHPIYDGDRFYVFACSICNAGTEFIRRLKINLIDLVHLILFNLTKLENDRKYHHLNKTIIPYAIQNWDKLQLSDTMKNYSHKDIQKKIHGVLVNNSRFKNGKEIKKNTLYWGLRSRIPPPPPKIIIPKDVIKITDQYLKSNLKLNFLSPTKNFINSEDELIESKSNSDQKFSSEDEIPIKNIIEKQMNSNRTEPQQIQLSRRKKKHTFYPTLPPANDFDQKQVKNLTDFVNSSEKKFSTSTTVDSNNFCDSSDDNSSLGTLDIRIPPPKNFQGRNNPFRVISPKKNSDIKLNLFKNISGNFRPSSNIKSNINNICINNNNNKTTSKSIDLSSKLVALKKSSVNLFNGGLPSDFQAAGQFRIVRTFKRRLSAKDLVIGPNKEIKKRRLRLSSGSGNVEVISTTIQSLNSKSKSYITTFPKVPPFNFGPSNAITTANTISSSASSSSMSSASASNTPKATTPTKLELNTSNIFPSSSTNTFRNLRKREEKNYADNHRKNPGPSVNNNSLVNLDNSGLSDTTKNNSFNEYQYQSAEDISELQSSVNMYFGAVERIKNGEKFTVRGKRTLPTGRIQYLIEWEGCAQAGQ